MAFKLEKFLHHCHFVIILFLQARKIKELAFYLAFYLTYILAFYLKYILAFYLAFYLAYILAFYLAVEVQHTGLGRSPVEPAGLGKSPVEVQRCPFNSTRSRGPAVPTDIVVEALRSGAGKEKAAEEGAESYLKI